MFFADNSTARDISGLALFASKETNSKKHSNFSVFDSALLCASKFKFPVFLSILYLIVLQIASLGILVTDANADSWPMLSRDMNHTGRSDFTIPLDRLNAGLFDEIIWQTQAPLGGGSNQLQDVSPTFFDGAGPDGRDILVSGYHWPKGVQGMDRHTGEVFWFGNTTGGEAIGHSAAAFSPDGATVYVINDDTVNAAFPLGHPLMAFFTAVGPAAFWHNGSNSNPDHLAYSSVTISPDGKIFSHQWTQTAAAATDLGSTLLETWIANAPFFQHMGHGRGTLYEDNGLLKVFTPSRSAILYAWDGVSGSQLWQLNLGATLDGTPTIDPANGNIYLTGFTNNPPNSTVIVAGLNKNGLPLWGTSTVVVQVGTPGAQLRAHAGALSYDGASYYFQTVDAIGGGALIKIDTATGSIRWILQTGNKAQGEDGRFANLIVTPNGVIIFGTHEGGTYLAVQDLGDSAVTFAQLNAGEGTRASASPILAADGTFYLGGRLPWTHSNGNGQVPTGGYKNVYTAFNFNGTDREPPDEITDLSVNSFESSIGLYWTPPQTPDFAWTRVYKNGVNVSGNIPAGINSYILNGLQPATGYTIKVTTLDQSLNESPGITLQSATLLTNPSSVSAEGLNESIAVSWNAVVPADLVAGYRVYVETAPYSTVAGLTPKQIVSAATLSTAVSGLQNGVQYYVAVTTVNISGGESLGVIPVTSIPQGDVVGPSLSNPTFNGNAITSGTIIPASGILAINAQDSSNISRVEFSVNDGVNITGLGTAVGAGPVYTVNWNLNNLTEGNYTLIIKGFDTLENLTTLEIPVVISFAAPAAPIFTVPVNGLVTNQSNLQISGTAAGDSVVKIFNNGAQLPGDIPVSSVGSFGTNLTLVSGINSITATATSNGKTSLPSAPVIVTLDTTQPAAPTGLVSYAQEAGAIKLSWNSVLPAGTKYNLYRASISFSEIAAATKINSTPLTVTNYNDLPPSDGTWYYRAVSVSAAGNLSAPSQQTAAVSDRIAPFASSITYSSTGAIGEEGQMAPGLVTVTVTTNEPLLTAPFLTYAFDQGAGIPVALVAMGNNQYKGNFVITNQTANGAGVAVFSAHDLVNNQGAAVLNGANIAIDSHGPRVTSIAVTPSAPIQNDAANPVSLTAIFYLDEKPVADSVPEIGFKLLVSQPNATVISGVIATDETKKIWQAQFILPASAGENAPEGLSFTCSAQDELGNIETAIAVPNLFQIYQGELPPLAVPTGLVAKALPHGDVELTWNSVTNSVGYQLFRKAPGDAAIAPYGAIVPALEFIDSTSTDGEYSYAVASVRLENGQQSLSAPSAAVMVVADSVAPTAPSGLALQMSGQGVAATWAAGSAESGITYRLYRANIAQGVAIDISALTPVIINILSLAALDSTPSELDHAYGVTAVDAAGNESVASNTEYLNFALLPVATLSVVRAPDALPQISWSYSGTAASKFRLTENSSGASNLLYEGPALTFTDTGYNGSARLYTVTAIDGNGVAGVGRTILLPKVTVNFPTSFVLQRGVFNRLDFVLTNQQSETLDNVVLVALVNGIAHKSTPLTLAPGVAQVVPIIVGGYPTLIDPQAVEARLEITPQPGASVKVSTINSASVTSTTLPFTIETQNFIQGATGQVRFTVENTSAVTTELVMALNGGGLPSDQIRFVLKDSNGNTYSQKAVFQFLGESVITLANGTTVARVAAGTTFTSDWILIDVPANVPNSAIIVLEVDKYHSKLGTPEHIQIPGLGTSRSVSLQPPPYVGELISITPQSTFSEPITIMGRALGNNTSEVQAFVPLQLILKIAGFNYTINVVTDSVGEFTKVIDPASYVGGTYKVSVVYPGTIENPEQGNFTINRISFAPTSYQVSTPTNYVLPLNVAVTTGAGTAATGVKFQYLAQDQGGQVLPEGMIVQLPEATEIAPGTTKNITINLAAENSATILGLIYLRLVSNETGTEPIALLPISYTLSSAAPSISFTPPVFEIGVTQGSTSSGSIKINNNGLAPLLDAQLTLLLQDEDGLAAPSWAYS